jgi:Cu2+-containing amine oxidase
MLKVNVGNEWYQCDSMYGNYDYAMQWISYQDKLKEYIKKYKGEINGV